VNCFVAASRPTGALWQEARMINISNDNVPGFFLLLEMALEAKRLVSLV
jgi:hypothetical protein